MQRSYLFQELLLSEFKARKDKNQSYSLRAFAKSLEINPSSLSAIMNGKRSPPINSAHQMGEKLSLDNKAQVDFIDSIINFRKDRLAIQNDKTEDSKKEDGIYSVSKEIQQTVLDEETYYEIITDWEFYAVLNLLKIKGFEFEVENISRRLAISLDRAKYILDKLFESSLIEKNELGQVSRVHEKLVTPNDIPSAALKLAHINELNLAKEKIYNTPVNQRHFSSMTMAINSKKIKEAKKIIKEFKSNLSHLLEDDNQDEVYNLIVNFFPLTERETKSL